VPSQIANPHLVGKKYLKINKKLIFQPEDKEEMKDILDMKRVHNRMVQRRKTKGQKNIAFTETKGSTLRKTGPIPPLKSIPSKN